MLRFKLLKHVRQFEGGRGCFVVIFWEHLKFLELSTAKHVNVFLYIYIGTIIKV